MKNKTIILTLTLLTLFFTNCKSLKSLQNEKEKYTIIHESRGDINFDGISDVAIVSSKSDSEKGQIIVFIIDSKENVSKKIVNDNLTDTFIEMYNQFPEIEIKNGELTISYYGGMCHRESRNIIFKFNKELNDLFFETFNTSEHNVCNDSEPKGNEITNAALRKIKFTEFKDNF
ncbi:hypothetical protein J2X31_000522 [Flavobacterium arsenatis]|uniref:Lipoprotein n=1 Tax=Flavobacterium arsenatis TaxID=1484332 RepID=A0ABU1TKM7_9FLAO|nr:hypothetical protein [Flavobacterium arsenatis]MDR6966529.1 hypothetical protein [Flavobacterium arsenatis]